MSNRYRRVPADKVIKQIAKQLNGYDREPFQDVLATALACGPSKRSWKRLATQHPEKWARALNDVGRLAGYAQQVEHSHTHLHKQDPVEVARQLVTAKGRTKAIRMLDDAGLPGELLVNKATTTIEGDFDRVETQPEPAETAPDAL